MPPQRLRVNLAADGIGEFSCPTSRAFVRGNVISSEERHLLPEGALPPSLIVSRPLVLAHAAYVNVAGKLR